MSTDKESSAAGTDNRPPMLVESDYESWRIRIERYIRGKPLGKLIWRSIQNGPTPHPQITVTEGQGEAAVQVTRDKRDEEFTEIENNKELADIQATNILSQGLPRHVFNILNQTRTGKEIWDNVELLMKGSGKSLQQQKEELFDEYERFRAIGNESIHDYFVRFHKLINDMKITQLDIPTHQMNTKFVNNLPPYWAKYVTNVKNNKDISATTYVELYTYLKSYEPHAMKTLKKQEQSTSIVDPLAYLAQTTHYHAPTQTTTPPPPQYGPLTSSTPQQVPQSSNDAMLATMNQIVNLLSGFQKQFPPTNNQLRTSSNSRSHATVHDGQIITETVQRRAPGNVGNTGNRGTQNYGQMTDNVGKKVICYNCRGEGHVSRQCKEKKRVKDSQYFKDKMLLMEAKEKGTVLDAEAEAFLADVECTAPYDQPLAITTTNMFEVSHEDAYDSDVDEGPHAAAAFMANLSSTSGTNGATTSQVNEVHTDANQIFDNVNHLLTHEMHQEEHLDSDVESDIDDNTIPYHQYQLDSEVQDVPTEVSSAPPGEISMITILDDLRTQLDGHLKVNQEQSLVNDSLRAELARCKQEMVSLERNKVKHDLDQTIIQRNKRNAELEEENVLLKSKLSQNVESINSLKNESKKVVSEKKVLEDKYLEEIVCLKSANKVATEILQRFQQPTQTIPMLTKRPNLATHDLHKTALGRSNPWNLKQAKLSQPTLYDGHALLNPTHTSIKVHDSEDSLVHAEVSKTKMSERLGTIKPINYAELNALYSHFVPQKELSREQVYWLPAEELATQKSNPPKPVTPFVRTRPAKSQISTCLQGLNSWIPAFAHVINQRTDPCRYPSGSGEFKPVKAISNCLCEELRSNCDREHSKVVELEAEILKKQQMLNESEKRCPLSQRNTFIITLKDQLQGKDDTIRNLQTQINITRMLNVGSTVGSFDKQALETELTQLKDALTSVRIQIDGFRQRKNHNVNTTKIAWRPTEKVVGSVKPQWKPTGRHFALYDNCPLTRIMEPIVEPLELTPSVSSSSKVTMISRFTDCKLSDRKAGSKGISGAVFVLYGNRLTMFLKQRVDYSRANGYCKYEHVGPKFSEWRIEEKITSNSRKSEIKMKLSNLVIQVSKIEFLQKHKFMSADSAVTYTFVHPEARSWSIPFEDPYEEAARQLLKQAPRSPKYVHDPMELEDHVPVAAMAQMRAAAPSTYHPLLPSGTPPLLLIPLPAPSTNHRADIPEADTQPQKRLLLTAPRPRCEVWGEFSAAACCETAKKGPIWPVGSITVYVRRRESSEFYSRHHEAQKDHSAVRAEIEVLRRERLTYEKESIETYQALARSEAYSRTLEARITALEAGAREDTLEDTGSSA
ncbi:retrovirus-related pol polyprotein from transposon TNT 1-94 [Tanacetum coccineum]